LRALLELARNSQEGPIRIEEIARRQTIPKQFLANLLVHLKRGRFVQSKKGPEGGYYLARPARQINVGEVLATLGGRLYGPSFCDSHAGVERSCTHMPDCSIRSVWRMLQNAIDRVLGKITLKDLLVSEREMNAFPSAAGPALPAYSQHT